MLKCLRPFILLLLFTACTLVNGQSVIGLTKEEVKALIKKDYKEYRTDNSIVKQQFNYLKYVNGMKTRTWILYFTDNDICKTSKLVCDYSEFDEVMEDLGSSFEKVGDSQWEYLHENDTIQVILAKQEWYFTVRETRKN